MKKLFLSITSILAISSYSFADIAECYKSSSNEIIQNCTSYLKQDKYPEATGMLAVRYIKLKDFKKGLDYSLWVINLYSKNKNLNQDEDKLLAYTKLLHAVGNIYYFGQAGKADKTKGLKYITKAANLGNDLTQEQLGDFYNSQGGDPDLNISQTYKWYTLANANGRSLDFKDFLNNMKNNTPYCLAMGEQLVAQAYIDGSAGLSKDTTKAKKYLKDAIALYKDNEPTKENLQYCKTGADKLNLESAKKQLDSL